MYAPMDIDGEDYYAKPMNCPFHIQIYKSRKRSYRDLPRRYAEYGTVYRYEKSGVLHGLTRVRGFTQDDAHVFCRPDQVESEISRALDFSLYILRAMGLTNFKAYLATRPEKFVGEVADWDKAIQALRRAVEVAGIAYEMDEGGGAFYGPKIDLKVNDALGREWQLSTIQFDFNMSVRFGLEYTGEDGQPQRPYMVHRALLGSMERFFGVLIEHYAGAFPLWLAPVQMMVIPISDKHVDYARDVAEALKAQDFRVEVDERSERMQAKIRDAQLQKIPFMLVVGNKEAETGTVSVRLRSGEDLKSKPVAEVSVARVPPSAGSSRSATCVVSPGAQLAGCHSSSNACPGCHASTRPTVNPSATTCPPGPASNANPARASPAASSSTSRSKAAAGSSARSMLRRIVVMDRTFHRGHFCLFIWRSPPPGLPRWGRRPTRTSFLSILLSACSAVNLDLFRNQKV